MLASTQKVDWQLPKRIAAMLAIVMLVWWIKGGDAPTSPQEQQPQATAPVAEPVAKSFVTPAATKPLVQSRFAGDDWKDVTFPAEVTKDQCARVELPMGLNIKWEPQAPVTYHVKTSYKEDKEFPAVTQAEIKMETPLAPWFEICAEEPLTLNITAEKPKRSS